MRPRHALKTTLRDYCENTSLHGFAYWVSSRKLIERFFWVVIVCGFLSCCAVILVINLALLCLVFMG